MKNPFVECKILIIASPKIHANSDSFSDLKIFYFRFLFANFEV